MYFNHCPLNRYFLKGFLIPMFYFWLICWNTINSCWLTHWRLNEIAHDPPLIPWRFLEYFRMSESTKIKHMRSNHRHKIGFQDVVYSKLNKWRAKILKNIDKKTSTWCVKLIRKQEIILFLYSATKCPADAEIIEYAKMSSLLTSEDKMKPNTTGFPFLYYLGWHLRKQQKIKAKNSSKNQSEHKKSNNFFAERRNSITAEERWKLQLNQKDEKNQANYLEINRISAELN